MRHKNLHIDIKFILLFCLLSFFTLQNSYSQWTQIDGLSWGDVSSVIKSNGILLAATYYAGFYWSTNNGNLWEPYIYPYYSNHLYSLGFNPYTYNDIVAGIDTGIIQSYNNGISWIPTNITSDTVYCFKNDNNISPPIIYAGSSRHLYYSINGGDFWISTSLNKSITGIEVLNGNVIAAANDNIYVSSNNGTDWSASNLQQKAFSLSVLNNKIYAGASYGIYYSTNNGSNWVTTSLHNYGVYRWDIGTAGNNLVAYSSMGIYLSTDEGATWSQRSNFTPGNNYSYFDGIAYIPSSEGKIFYSTNNGFNWNVNQLNNRNVSSLQYKPGMLFAAIDGLYYSTNSGINWSQYPDFQNKSITALASNNNIILAAYIEDSLNGILKRTTNNGLNWNSTNLNVQGGIWTLAFKGNSDTAFTGVFAQHGVRKSVDGGYNWLQTSLNAYTVRGFAFLKDKIFVATGPDGQSSHFGVFVSSDQGQNWNITAFDLIDAISIATAGSRIFVGTMDSLYYSDDIGSSWKSVHFPLHWPSQIIALDSMNIIVGTNWGIYSTTNSGLNWHDRGEGFYNNEYYKITALARVDSYIFCGAYYRSLWKRPISDFVGINDEQKSVPEKYSLEQNYPNPFNSSTIIRYNVSKSADINIRVFDITGREVMTLAEGYKTPGKYQVSFSGETLTSGIYFYRLETKTYTETKKMIIIK